MRGAVAIIILLVALAIPVAIVVVGLPGFGGTATESAAEPVAEGGANQPEVAPVESAPVAPESLATEPLTTAPNETAPAPLTEVEPAEVDLETPVAVPGEADPGAPAAPAAEAPLVFDVDEPTLNQQVNTWVEGRTIGGTPFGPVTAQQIAVDLQDDEIQVAGDARVLGLTLPVSGAATFNVQDGRPIVKVHESRLGFLPLPTGAAQRIAQEQVDAALATYEVRVESLDIADDQVRATLRPE